MDVSKLLDDGRVEQLFQTGREELRRRFLKAETTLFRSRYDSDDTHERELFLKSMEFDWTTVGQILSSRVNHQSYVCR